MKPGRNDACACGSGRKYKHCCERKQTKREHLRDSVGKGLFYMFAPLILVIIVVAAIGAMRSSSSTNGEPPKVWSAKHGHYHYRMPDGTEIEVRPGMTWSAEQNRFVEAEPITGSARKHVTSDLEQRFSDTEADLGN